MPASRIHLLAALALAVALVTPSSAAGRPLARLGLMDDALFSYQPAFAFRALEHLHPQVIRFDVDWPAVAVRRPRNARNPDDPAYRFWRTDQIVKKAAAMNIPVVLTIVHTPGWAGGSPRHNQAPTRLSDLQDFAYAAALRYSGRFRPHGGRPLPAVERWEAWNEPNTQTHLTPQFVEKGGRWQPASPAIYVKLLGAIYDGIHAAGRAQHVGEIVAGGATKPNGHTPRSAEPSVAPLTFLQEIGRLGARFDVYSHHPYRTSVRGLPSRNGDIGMDNLGVLLTTLDRLYPGKSYHLWITEYGVQTKPPDRFLGVPPEQQAASLRSVVGYARRNPRIDMVIWFLIRDEIARGQFDGGFQTGLAWNNGTTKPAWSAFQDMAWARRGFVLTSPAVRHGLLNRSATCDGGDRSPILRFAGVPSGTRSLALLVEDPTGEGGTFVHWLVTGIPSSARTLPGAIPHSGGTFVQGRNGFSRTGYGGACPPGGRPHTYRFRLLALDRRVRLAPGFRRRDFDRSVIPHVIGQALLVARYGR